MRWPGRVLVMVGGGLGCVFAHPCMCSYACVRTRAHACVRVCVRVCLYKREKVCACVHCTMRVGAEGEMPLSHLVHQLALWETEHMYRCMCAAVQRVASPGPWPCHANISSHANISLGPCQHQQPCQHQPWPMPTSAAMPTSALALPCQHQHLCAG